MKTLKGIGISLITIMLCLNFASCGGSDEEPLALTTENPWLDITPESSDYFNKGMTFDNASSKKFLSFITNVDWKIAVAPTGSEASWFSIYPTSGFEGLHSLQVKAAENTGYDDRSVTLTITLSGSDLKKSITVIQKQKDALTLTANKFELDAKGGIIDVEVKANVSYEVVIPESCKSWISKTPSSRGITATNLSFKIESSEEINKREGQITIKSGNLSETIRVYQAEKDMILLTKKEYLVSDKGETIEVEVKSNVDYAPEMPNVDWVTSLSTSKGPSSTIHTFSIKQNNSYNIRDCAVVFKSSDKSLSETLVIKQSEKEGLGNGGQYNCFMVSEGGLYRFSIGNYEGDKAFILWNENGKSDITEVELKDKYIYFNKPSFKKGNAMISLSKGDEIVWSWHIWSTDMPKTFLVNGEKWMDRNMGATSTAPNNPDVYGLCYNPGNPFPFPGAKYADYEITTTPSVPNGWYVASGYGYYKSTAMPKPSNPMQLCTYENAYGNSVYFRIGYSQLPQGYILPSATVFQSLLGYEPQIKDNGVYPVNNLYIPATYRNIHDQNHGVYLCHGIYNTIGVSTWIVYFHEQLSKKSYCDGAELLPIRCYTY